MIQSSNNLVRRGKRRIVEVSKEEILIVVNVATAILVAVGMFCLIHFVFPRLPWEVSLCLAIWVAFSGFLRPI